MILFSFRKFLIIEVLARNDYPFKYEAKYNFLFDNTNNLLKSKNQHDIKTDFEFVLSVFLNFLNDLSEAYEDYAKNPGLWIKKNKSIKKYSINAIFNTEKGFNFIEISSDELLKRLQFSPSLDFLPYKILLFPEDNENVRIIALKPLDEDKVYFDSIVMKRNKNDNFKKILEEIQSSLYPTDSAIMDISNDEENELNKRQKFVIEEVKGPKKEKKNKNEEEKKPYKEKKKHKLKYPRKVEIEDRIF